MTDRRKEGVGLKLFHVRLDPKLIYQLKLKAVREHTTVQTLMDDAVRQFLKPKPAKEGR
jgi:hypothetical protein